MANLSQAPLPDYRARNWIGKWFRSNNAINPEAVEIMKQRANVLIDRWDIKADYPQELSRILDGIAQKYNGLIYEENGIIMEIDLFIHDDDKESFLFGIGNTPIFNRYLYDYRPELLI